MTLRPGTVALDRDYFEGTERLRGWPPSGGTERGERLREPRRRKHHRKERASRATDEERNESRERSRSGLSRCSLPIRSLYIAIRLDPAHRPHATVHTAVHSTVHLADPHRSPSDPSLKYPSVIPRCQTPVRRSRAGPRGRAIEPSIPETRGEGAGGGGTPTRPPPETATSPTLAGTESIYTADFAERRSTARIRVCQGLTGSSHDHKAFNTSDGCIVRTPTHGGSTEYPRSSPHVGDDDDDG